MTELVYLQLKGKYTSISFTKYLVSGPCVFLSYTTIFINKENLNVLIFSSSNVILKATHHRTKVSPSCYCSIAHRKCLDLHICIRYSPQKWPCIQCGRLADTEVAIKKSPLSHLNLGTEKCSCWLHETQLKRLSAFLFSKGRSLLKPPVLYLFPSLKWDSAALIPKESACLLGQKSYLNLSHAKDNNIIYTYLKTG